PVLDGVALFDRGSRPLARVGEYGILGPEEGLGRDRVAEIGCRPTGRWTDEVVLVEARLGVELLLVEIERDRFSVSRCLREHVLADDDVAAEQSAGGDNETGYALRRRIDEHSVDFPGLVPVLRPDLRLQIDAHRVPPSGHPAAPFAAGLTPPRTPESIRHVH